MRLRMPAQEPPALSVLSSFTNPSRRDLSLSPPRAASARRPCVGGASLKRHFRWTPQGRDLARNTSGADSRGRDIHPSAVSGREETDIKKVPQWL
ncbi:hypothetical protein NDU88_000026 [Pleurodeles waltl]|uniref:Uncharacterized protein n=1 Tax=Pleurodeles waltl TaxID=8319 RepID=A0AAV7SVC7_PLEWA|nr:hypothetical protein NDU88_000026 [Pleurodeles waltl]